MRTDAFRPGTPRHVRVEFALRARRDLGSAPNESPLWGIYKVVYRCKSQRKKRAGHTPIEFAYEGSRFRFCSIVRRPPEIDGSQETTIWMIGLYLGTRVIRPKSVPNNFGAIYGTLEKVQQVWYEKECVGLNIENVKNACDLLLVGAIHNS